jgi:hypothetical protein
MGRHERTRAPAGNENTRQNLTPALSADAHSSAVASHTSHQDHQR